MNMPVLKTEPTITLPVTPAEVVRLKTLKVGFVKAKLLPMLQSVAAQVIPFAVPANPHPKKLQELPAFVLRE